MSQTATQQPRSKYRSVALPAEHGGWGFLIEPMVAGLLIAPSWAGFWLCLAALGVFLIHQPLKVALKDALKGRTYERTRWARRFALAYGSVALVSFVLVLSQPATMFWLPLVIAAPLALIQLSYEARNRGREFLPEVAGALALGATGPAVVILGGGTLEVAFLLWGLIALRTLPALLYVRIALRTRRDATGQRWPAIAAHIVAIAIVAALASLGLVSWLALLAMVFLLGRAVYALSPGQAATPARVIGMREMVFGLIFALLAGLSLR